MSVNNYIGRQENIGRKVKNFTLTDVKYGATYGEDIACCICDCGNYKEIIFLRWYRGEVKSCGCLNRKPVLFIKDGELRLCKGPCGQLKLLSKEVFASKNSRLGNICADCRKISGRPKVLPKDYSVHINETHGKLHIDSVDGVKATCSCNCGNIKSISVARILSGKVKSCGCLKPRIDETLAEMNCSSCDQVKIFTKEFFCEKPNGKLTSKCLICDGAHLRRPRVKVKDMTKEYYENKKIQRTEYNRVYEVERKKIDPSFKIRRQTAQFFNSGLIKRKISKNGHSNWDFLPYTESDLNKHIESQFESWMNWGNRGKYNKETWNDEDPSTWTWQIDHIIPQADFDIKELGDAQWLACQALFNLRPLSAKQNILDGTSGKRHMVKRKLKKRGIHIDLKTGVLDSSKLVKEKNENNDA